MMKIDKIILSEEIIKEGIIKGHVNPISKNEIKNNLKWRNQYVK